jgi:hypothetical protein
MVPVCGRKCNSKVDLGHKTLLIENLVKKIKKELKRVDKSI